MDDGGLALALGAGMLSAVNPCGFALLPAYLSLVVLDDTSGRGRSVVRALGLSAAMTIGFVAVFGVFGLVVSPLASGLQAYLPYVTLTLGLLLALVGGWVLWGGEVPGLRWRPRGPRVRRGFWPMLLFGVSYGVASLSCTIAPFLAVVVASFRSGSPLDGTALFVAYALGMGLVVTTCAVAVSLARTSVVTWLRRAGRWLPRATGALLLVVGLWVAYYGAWELRVLDGATGPDPVIDAAAAVQGAVARLVSRTGAARLLVALAVLVAVPLVARLLPRPRVHR